MAGAMHEIDYTYSIWITWLLHQLAIDVPPIDCVINLQNIFVYYLDWLGLLLESGLWYVWVFLPACLMLVYSVNVAGCHHFDFS